MRLLSVGYHLWRKFLDQPVISTASGEDFAALPVKNALKKDTPSVKLVVQAAQWVHINLALDTEALEVCHEHVQTSEDCRDSLGKFSALHDCVQSSLRPFQSV